MYVLSQQEKAYQQKQIYQQKMAYQQELILVCWCVLPLGHMV
jgi:hypothetical protein